MIVKLTYSADLDEIPSEVSKIVLGSASDMKDVMQELNKVVKELSIGKDADVPTALSKIRFALKSVEKLDVRLKDCESILGGYLGVLEQEKEKQQNQTQNAASKVKEKEDEEETKRTTRKKAG